MKALMDLLRAEFFGGVPGWLVVVGLVLYVASVVWAFKDARFRGRSGTPVAVLVLLLWPLGLALWLLTRPGAAARWRR